MEKKTSSGIPRNLLPKGDDDAFSMFENNEDVVDRMSNFDETYTFDVGGPARCTHRQFKQWLVYLTGQAGTACTRPFFNACCSGCRPSKDMTKCYADCWNNKKANLNIPDICYEGRDPTDRSGKTPTFQGGRMMSNMKWSQQLAQCDAVGMSRCRWTGK